MTRNRFVRLFLAAVCVRLLITVVSGQTAQRSGGLAQKPSPPPDSGAIVKKPQSYWKAYSTDIIRQVFDGGFGSDVDEDDRFKLLFNTYVEAFSSNCRAYLPPNHQTVVVSKVTTRTDRYGAVTQESAPQGNVEVDTRFAAKYRQFGNQLSSSAHGLGTALAVGSGRATVKSTLAPGRDMFQFFKAETCQSAAMRQLGENLLRGATGQRSLQQTAATRTAGAGGSAATGGFTHLVDACNAWYRDPANVRYAPLDANAYCKCLGDQLQFAMSPADEAYFAADYGRHFRDDILQPRNEASHAAWGRLNPLARRCAR